MPRALVDGTLFPAAKEGSPYMAPQILVDVDHSMRVMTEETFGPVVGIMKVASDEEAIAHMNDSAFGLTAAIFTRDEEAAIRIGDAVETGTWFMNRCDYLDPALAWTGVKDSGTRLQPQRRRLRAADPAEILPPENRRVIPREAHRHDRNPDP